MQKLPLTCPDFGRESIALLALASIKGVGYWTLRKLRKRIAFAAVFDVDSINDFNQILREAGVKTILREEESGQSWGNPLLDTGANLFAELESKGISVIHSGSPDYPPSLYDVDDSPYWLFVQGNKEILKSPSIAIVGTRKPSNDGQFLCRYVGHALASIRYPTVSGLAEGIDQVIHRMSIKYEVPTIAVLGSGILLDYPSRSESLKDVICESEGAIVSEYLPYDKYSAQNFVRRNRIQAGLAKVLIPVEWSIKSGTAHTVKYAYKYNKRIVCLRVPCWDDMKHQELLLAEHDYSASVFSIPGEEEMFLQHLKTAMEEKIGQCVSSPELKLWENEEEKDRK